MKKSSEGSRHLPNEAVKLKSVAFHGFHTKERAARVAQWLRVCPSCSSNRVQCPPFDSLDTNVTRNGACFLWGSTMTDLPECTRLSGRLKKLMDNCNPQWQQMGHKRQWKDREDAAELKVVHDEGLASLFGSLNLQARVCGAARRSLQDFEEHALQVLLRHSVRHGVFDRKDNFRHLPHAMRRVMKTVLTQWRISHTKSIWGVATLPE